MGEMGLIQFIGSVLKEVKAEFMGEHSCWLMLICVLIHLSYTAQDHRLGTAAALLHVN